MAYIAVNGVDHYYEWITSSNGEVSDNKPVMVFIHGWAGSSRYWRSTALALSEQFNCLLYDMRGFGRSLISSSQRESVAQRGYELDTFAEDLAELLNQLSLDRVYINSHSMGASIAVFFLNHFPQRVHQAILTCNGVFEYDEKAFKAFYQFGGYVVAFRPKWLRHIPLMPRFFMARFLHRSIPAAEKIAFLEDFLAADYDTALGTIFTSVSKQATEIMPLEFSKISVLTLLISGEFDQITPAELGKQAAALNPQIDYRLIRGTGHFPMLEDPETYLADVRQFLSLEARTN